MKKGKDVTFFLHAGTCSVLSYILLRRRLMEKTTFEEILRGGQIWPISYLALYCQSCAYTLDQSPAALFWCLGPKDTQYFSQFDQILPSRDERNPQNNADAV